ncbi:hypothetical protein FVA95_09955 [Pseudonocardia sp. EV170527-09]|uniref:alpha/beta fold hydrolase n=1 Tax=Pseudonocardia sp. EV170527-09 TaxID=2603411 RepID=UPI0011F2E1EB|nr:hypothetical protein [Pseudonocardia sp. EV170527-09]KAA1030423.1 hypothetical protein FVA95_09955 [Pseudonocardia sp. EV170527-09]
MHVGGSGTPMVLLHGATSSWRARRPVLPALERHHHVAAPTLAGRDGGPVAPDGRGRPRRALTAPDGP